MEFQTLHQLLSNPPDPVGSLWGNSMLPCKGLTLLHSGSKMGKSMMLMNLAIAGATGKPSFLGQAINGPFTSLIFQGEIHLRGIYERADLMIRAMAERGEVTEEQLSRIWINNKREERLSDLTTFLDFQETVRAIRPDFIGLDPLAHVLTTNENDNAIVGAMLERLALLRDDPGSSILLVHHDAKINESTAMRSPQQRARGADRLNADPDCILSLTPGPRLADGPTGTLHVASRYGRTVPPFGVKLNENTLWFEHHIERGQPQALVQWIQELGCDNMEEDQLIEKIEQEWNLHDASQHRAAKTYIRKAMQEGFLTVDSENGGVTTRYYVRKEEGMI